MNKPMRTFDIQVHGMTCLNCARHVQTAVQSVPGIRAARVDYRAGRGQVRADEGIDTRDVLEAVAGAGYRAELVDGDGRRGRVGPQTQDPSRPSPAPGGHDFDLLIIGTGGAGVAAAIEAAGLGVKVAVAEGGTLGGTCVNIGCIPSKNLIEAAAHVHGPRQGFPGVTPCSPRVDWPAVIEAKDTLVTSIRKAKYSDVLASYPTVVRLDGRAQLLDNGRVAIGDTQYRARKLLIATGTSPAVPPIPGLEAVEWLTSTTAMELESLPASLIVIGGGPVGVELGQVFARFGVKVIIVQRRTLLPDEEPLISAALQSALEAEGIEIHTGVTVVQVDREDRGVVVHVRQGSMTGQLRAERLLVAAGRKPNTSDMGLEAAGVVTTPDGFVQVDAGLRTTNPDIFAAGDVTGGPGYVYVAAAGGRIAAANAIKGEFEPLDLSSVPRVTFTDPQVAAVGFTEAAARASGYDIETSTLDLAHLPRALVTYRTQGLVRLVAEAGTERLLGVHALGASAGELMGEATLAVRFGLTAKDLGSTLHPYLTWTEAMRLAAQEFTMDVTKLSCCA